MSHHQPTAEKALWIAVILNAAFMVLEAVVGWWSNSLALISDAGHMASDVGALAIAIITLRLAAKRAFGGFTFGLRRAPVVGGLLNATALVVMVLLIGAEAVGRMAEPPTYQAQPVFWTSLAGLAVNLVSAWYLARSGDKSINTRGAMLHLLADAMGSVAAVLSSIAMLFFDFALADPIGSVIIAALILLGSWPLLRDAVALLLQGAPRGVKVEAVAEALRGAEGVVSVDDLHIWALDAGEPVLTAVVAIDADGLAEATARIDALHALLAKNFDIHHGTIEVRSPSAPKRRDEH